MTDTTVRGENPAAAGLDEEAAGFAIPEKAPFCRYCGRPLKPCRLLEFFDSMAEAEAAVATRALLRPQFKEYTHGSPGHRVALTFQVAWGAYGDNAFCNLRHAAKWAACRLGLRPVLRY